jgi:chromosome segregation ATPase
MITMQEINAALKPIFDEFRSEFTSIRAQFQKIDARFEKMDSRFDKMDARFDRMAVQVAQLTGDVAELKIATKSDIASLKNDIFQKIDGFLPVVENARKQKEVSDASFWRHEERLDDHEGRLSRLEKKD